MELDRRPEYRKPSFDCQRCGAFAAQEWNILAHAVEGGKVKTVVDEDWRAFVEDMTDVSLGWETSRCSGCQTHSLWIDEEMVFPAVPGSRVFPPATDMPAEVVELYMEAAATLPHSKRAAAALCRAALERLAKYLTSEMPVRSRLDDRLAKLSSGSSPALVQMLHVIRFAGNIALHGDDGKTSALFLDESDSTIAGHFFKALNMLVEERVTSARAVAGLYGSLPQGMRDEIERKSGVTA